MNPATRLIKLAARQVDEDARARLKYDEAGGGPLASVRRNRQIRFAKLGTSIAPDATFTLRLAFGTVQGYEVDGASSIRHDVRPDVRPRRNKNIINRSICPNAGSA